MHTILCFGDSITFGIGEKPARGWCYRLKDWFEPKHERNKVYNLGISGNTSTNLLERFDCEIKARLKSKSPDDEFLVLVAIGTNDSKNDGDLENYTPRIDENDFRSNIRKLIEMSRTHKVRLALLGLTPVGESRGKPLEDNWFDQSRVKLFNGIIREECLTNNVLFLDLFAELADEESSEILADGLHPNSKGYDLMFEKVKQFLEEKRLLE